MHASDRTVISPPLDSYPPHIIRRHGYTTLAGFALLWVVTLATLWGTPSTNATVLPIGTVVSAIDPNAAPWWELAALPRIGEGIARRIIVYRGSHATSTPDGTPAPAFKSAVDMGSVRGIGPKTLLRIGPYLRFEHR